MTVGRAWGAIVKRAVYARVFDLNQDVVRLEIEGAKLYGAGGYGNFLQGFANVWFWIKINSFCELHGGISN